MMPEPLFGHDERVCKRDDLSRRGTVRHKKKNVALAEFAYLVKWDGDCMETYVRECDLRKVNSS